jgi:hypothetical protein
MLERSSFLILQDAQASWTLWPLELTRIVICKGRLRPNHFLSRDSGAFYFTGKLHQYPCKLKKGRFRRKAYKGFRGSLPILLVLTIDPNDSADDILLRYLDFGSGLALTTVLLGLRDRFIFEEV